MQRNPFWILFITLILMGTVGYTTYALIKVWHYIRLDSHTETQNISWSMISSNEDAFVLFAHYSFIKDGKIYHGQTRWQEAYLNQWAAKEAIARLKQSPPAVWFNSSSAEISSLQKLFPLKESIYAGLLWSLGIYFLGLGYYVNRRFL